MTPPVVLPGPAVEPSPRWIRVKFGDTVIADSRRTLLLREYAGHRHLPTYYFPQADVRMDLLRPGAENCLDVCVGDQVVSAGAWTAPNPAGEHAALAGHLTFAWYRELEWYEEEERQYAHARDPYYRVDAIPSSRHVRVVVGGVTVGESRRPTLVFETGMPVRYYLPQDDIRMDLLAATDLHTRCPYKGLASYWTLSAGDTLLENAVWGYLDPIPECPKIRGLLCFYPERVELYVDGERQ